MSWTYEWGYLGYYSTGQAHSWMMPPEWPPPTNLKWSTSETELPSWIQPTYRITKNHKASLRHYFRSPDMIYKTIKNWESGSVRILRMQLGQIQDRGKNRSRGLSHISVEAEPLTANLFLITTLFLHGE